MERLTNILEKAGVAAGNLTVDEMTYLLSLEDKEDVDMLFSAAYGLKVRYIGKRVSLRGLIEGGNYCSKNCLYCGIRSSNRKLARYQLSVDEVERLAHICCDDGYGSMVLQSGELESEAHTRYIEEILERIRPLNLGITLSLGEQSYEVYKRWRELGAHRYLLRIETTNRDLYSLIHPSNHSFERRLDCLRDLRRLDYQVGTGVMCSLPNQTFDDLAKDIQFFYDMDVDMIGMGPYIEHPDTPLGQEFAGRLMPLEKRLDLALKMIAVTRIQLHNVNIASSTALQAIDEFGREKGLLAGANVLMPNVTDVRFRTGYQLYLGKPGLDENKDEFRNNLEKRIHDIGEELIIGERGDSPHYKGRRDSNAW